MQQWKTRVQQWLLSDRQNWRQASGLVRWLWAVGGVLFLLSSIMPRFSDGTLGAAWKVALLLSGLTLYFLGVQLNTQHLMFSRFDRISRWAGFGLLGLLLIYGLYQLFTAYAHT